MSTKHTAEATGPYYTLRGFDADGKRFVAMPIFAASAGLDVVKGNALGMLQDAGYDCASADAVDMPKTNAIPPGHKVVIVGGEEWAVVPDDQAKPPGDTGGMEGVK